LIQVAGEQEVPAPVLDIEHETARVVRRFRVPASRWVKDCETGRPASTLPEPR
jgi:hypothetical protein